MLSRWRVVLLVTTGSVAVGVGVTMGIPLLTPWTLVAMGAAAAMTPALLAIASRRFDPFEPVHLFAATYAVLFVVRPAFDLSTQGTSPVVLGYSTGATYGMALAIALVGLLSFYAGYYSRLGERLGELVPLPRAMLAPAQLSAGVLLTLGWSVGLFTLFVAGNGGIEALATVLQGRSLQQQQAFLDSSGYFYTGLLWLTGPALLLLATARRWLAAPGLVAFGLLTLSQLVSIADGDRSWTLPVACSLIVLWYLRRGRRPRPGALVTIVIVSFLLGVVAPLHYRNVGSGQASPTEAIVRAFAQPGQGIQAFFEGADTAMVDDLAVELQFVPDIAGFRYGATYLEALTRPVPRALWPAKPQAADVELMQLIWPTFAREHVGFAFSLLGEPYLNWGLPGVALICAILGVTWRGLWTWFTRAPHNPLVMTLYALAWPFVFVYMRGGLGVDYPRQVIAMLPVILIAVASRVHSQREAEAGTGHARVTAVAR